MEIKHRQDACRVTAFQAAMIKDKKTYNPALPFITEIDFIAVIKLRIQFFEIIPPFY